MAAITVQEIDYNGTAVTMSSAAGGGDTFANDNSGRTFFKVTNGGGGAINVTFTAQKSSITTAQYGTLDIFDLVVSVDAGATTYFGPFDGDVYNNSSGAVAVGYSGVTSVTVAALKLA